MNNQEKTVAIVTGASRGIGRAIALRLAQSGYQVPGTATTPEGAERISAYIAEAGCQGAGFVLNVTDQESVDTCLAQIVAKFSAPLILVNNAGITKDNLLLRMKLEDWNAVLEANLTSIFRLCKAVARPMMKARWGRIVNISSVVASTGNAGQANYSASKAGIIGVTKSLALEFATRDITVNAVAPGFIETEMTQVLSEEQKKILFSSIPMRKFGRVSDIANMVDFLISKESDYITGQTMHINGGMFMN